METDIYLEKIEKLIIIVGKIATLLNVHYDINNLKYYYITECGHEINDKINTYGDK